jgi:hypothetical protein
VHCLMFRQSLQLHVDPFGRQDGRKHMNRTNVGLKLSINGNPMGIKNTENIPTKPLDAA